MSKQAKISITADTKGFKAQIDSAKKQAESLFKMKMSPEASNGFRKMLGDQFTGQIKAAEKSIGALQKRMEQVGKGSIVDQKKLDHYIARVEDLTEALDKAKKAQKGLGSIGAGPMAAKPGEQKPPPEPPAPGGGLADKLGDVVKGMGLALGAMYIYQRRLGMAKERTSIRELGAAVGSETSTMGFTPAERRSRMLDTAKASGENLSAYKMDKLTDLGETAQRAYGIDQSESTGAMKTARQAGGEGDKYLANTIGAATAAGLEGSRIGEFLQASSESLAEMSRGVTIDTGSLNGFAASLSTLPFFKNDPSKAFDAIKGINGAFTGGDRFQQAQASRSIQEAAGGSLNPAAVEQRRSAGIFGQIKPETREILNSIGAKDTSKAFGGDVLNKMVGNAVGQTKGMDGDSRLYEVMQRLGLKGEGGMQVAGKFIKAGGMKGSGVDSKSLANAQMDPQERLNKTMENVDGNMLKLNATLEQSLDKAVDGLTNTIIELTTQIVNLINKMGGKDAASNVGGAVIGAGTAYLGYKGLKGMWKKFRGGGAAAEGAAGAGEAGAIGAEGVAGAEGAGALGLGAEGAIAGEGLTASAGLAVGGGAGALMLGAAGVGAAGLAGVGVGMGINHLSRKYTDKKNRYGQHSDMLERGAGKAMTYAPSWAGGISDEQYDSMYGSEGNDSLMDKAMDQTSKKKDKNLSSGTGADASGAASHQSAGSLFDANTQATDRNTEAMNQLTQSLANQRGGRQASGGRPVRSGMKVGSHGG